MVVCIPGYSLRTSASIRSPVQRMIRRSIFSASVAGTFASQRTVKAAVTWILANVTALLSCAVRDQPFV